MKKTPFVGLNRDGAKKKSAIYENHLLVKHIYSTTMLHQNLQNQQTKCSTKVLQKANTFFYCTTNDGDKPFSLPRREDVMVENCFDNLGYRLLSDPRICVSRARGCLMTPSPTQKSNRYIYKHKYV